MRYAYQVPLGLVATTTLSGLLALAICCPAAAGPDVPPANPEAANAAPVAAESSSAEQQRLAEWVKQLDDDRYSVRKAAQKSLAAAGPSALAAVGRAAVDGSLESSTRAVGILSNWSESNDPALGMAALEQLATLKKHPTESSAAQERLATIREREALAAIRALGGHVGQERQIPMFVGQNDHLQVIIGPQWKGGVEGLRHVANIRRASTLSLHSAPLDDQAVPVLAELGQLQRIELYGTGISAAGVAAINEKLPNAKTDVRGPAQLGVQGTPDLLVQRVLSLSAAEKAGIREGDQIASYGGKPIETFEQLTAEIAKSQPGDSVDLEVLRLEQPGQPAARVTLKVTFDRWGDVPTIEDSPEAQEDPFGNVQVNGPIIIQQRR